MIAEERETVIQFDDSKDTVSIWTAQQRVRNRLLRAGYVPQSISKASTGVPVGWEFEIPLKKWGYIVRKAEKAK